MHSNKQNRFLLKLDYQSRPYATGVCGACTEIGFLIITFDRQFNYIDSQRILLESCEMGYPSEELPMS